MPAIVTHAIGKSILFGEHAVVYGYPAIAVPIPALRTKVVIKADIRAPSGTITFHAPDINIHDEINNLPAENVLVRAVQLFKETYNIKRFPSFQLTLTSEIPVASGLGSSASISVAIVKAIAQHMGLRLPLAKINDLAYELEKGFHGNPSGIDNTVVTYEKSLYYVRGEEPQFLQSPIPLHILLINSHVQSLTSEVVAAVRQQYEQDKERVQHVFQSIGTITDDAREALQQGNKTVLGELMNRNHALLQQLDISTPELDTIASTAQEAGALGAKLCGAGRGGNVIALVREADIPGIRTALSAQGFKDSIHTVIQ